MHILSGGLLLILLVAHASSKGCFYDYRDFPSMSGLGKLQGTKDMMLSEIESYEESWEGWPENAPERLIYGDTKLWTLLYLYGFGAWSKISQKFPKIVRKLKSIKNLKRATLSKIAPHTKLHRHQGWKESANQLRTHYTLKSNENCYLMVQDEFRELYEDDIMVFDDSKVHFAMNHGDTPKIALVVDIERPKSIPVGKSFYPMSPAFKNYYEKTYGVDIDEFRDEL